MNVWREFFFILTNIGIIYFKKPGVIFYKFNFENLIIIFNL